MKTNNFTMVNVDTDAISFCKADQSFISVEEREHLLQELNSLFPKRISFTDDGYFERAIVLKAKNYILYDGKKIKIKGSGLKSSKTEKAFKNFMGEVIDKLVFNKPNEILDVYHKYVKQIFNLKDISTWCSKKTITEAVLNPGRTNEQKVLDALGDKQVSMGDKYHMYFAMDKSLKLSENWNVNSPDHDCEVLLRKLYNTLNIFKSVVPMEQFPKYHLKNKKIKEKLNEIIF